MSTPYDWKIHAIEQKAEHAYSRLYELDTLRSDVGRLERADWETSTKIDGLCAQLEAALDEIRQLKEALNEAKIGETL